MRKRRTTEKGKEHDKEKGDLKNRAGETKSKSQIANAFNDKGFDYKFIIPVVNFIISLQIFSEMTDLVQNKIFIYRDDYNLKRSLINIQNIHYLI